MPLRPRQKNDAIDYIKQTLAAQGVSEEQMASSLNAETPEERERIFRNAWLKSQKTKQGEAGALGAAVAGFGEGTLPGVVKQVGGLVQGAVGAVTGEGFSEGRAKGVAEIEDRLTFHELTNPKAYHLAEWAGLLNPLNPINKLGAAAKVGKLGIAANLALRGAVEGGVQSTAVALDEGDSATDAAMRIGTGVALGAAMPSVVRKVGSSFGNVGKAAKSTILDTYAGAAKLYSKAMGSLTPRIDEILSKADDILTVQATGLDTAKRELADRSAQTLDELTTVLQEASDAVSPTSQEMTETTRSLAEYFKSGVRAVAQEISDKAERGAKIAKEEVADAFSGLAAMSKVAKAKVREQFGEKIRVFEAAGEADKGMRIADEVDVLAEELASLGIIKSSTNRSFTSSPMSQAVKDVLGDAFDMAKKDVDEFGAQLVGNRASWGRVNKLRDAVDELIDWNANDPLTRALKKFRGDLRGRLVERAKSYGTDVNADRLFSEYDEALKLGAQFKNVFMGKAAEGGEMAALPSTTTLRNMYNKSKGLTELNPFDEASRQAMQRIVRNVGREQKLKKLVDPTDVARQVQSMMKNTFMDADMVPAKFEKLVGQLQTRQQLLDVADTWQLPEAAKNAIKAGGRSFKDFMANLPPALKASRGDLQRLHDQHHKGLRINGYKAQELLEVARDKKILSNEDRKFWYELLSTNPQLERVYQDVQRLAADEKVWDLAASDLAKIQAPKLSLGQVAAPGVVWYLAGGKLAAALAGLHALHQTLSQPAAAALLAKKYKFVPSAQAEKWGTNMAHLTRMMMRLTRQGSAEVKITPQGLNEAMQKLSGLRQQEREP